MVFENNEYIYYLGVTVAGRGGRKVEKIGVPGVRCRFLHDNHNSSALRICVNRNTKSSNTKVRLWGKV